MVNRGFSTDFVLASRTGHLLNCAPPFSPCFQHHSQFPSSHTISATRGLVSNLWCKLSNNTTWRLVNRLNFFLFFKDKRWHQFSSFAKEILLNRFYFLRPSNFLVHQLLLEKLTIFLTIRMWRWSKIFFIRFSRKKAFLFERLSIHLFQLVSSDSRSGFSLSRFFTFFPFSSTLKMS